jgi:hypothetical protein
MTAETGWSPTGRRPSLGFTLDLCCPFIHPRLNATYETVAKSVRAKHIPVDKGFQDWHSTFEFYALDVDPLVLERGSSLEIVDHNALIRDAGYSQRWMAETSYPTTKCSLGAAMRAQVWYREFGECILMFALANLEYT